MANKYIIGLKRICLILTDPSQKLPNLEDKNCCLTHIDEKKSHQTTIFFIKDIEKPFTKILN